MERVRCMGENTAKTKVVAFSVKLTHANVGLKLFNQLFQLTLGINVESIRVQVAIDIVATHFFGKVSILNARDLCFGEANDQSVGTSCPIHHEIVKVSAGSSKDNDSVHCHMMRSDAKGIIGEGYQSMVMFVLQLLDIICEKPLQPTSLLE